MVLWSLLYYNLNQTITWIFLQLCMLIQVLNPMDGAWYEQSLLLRGVLLTFPGPSGPAA